MSGRYGPHLCRRNGIFHFKMRVPASIKSQIGLVEISRSLRTSSKFEARISAALAAARLRKVWTLLQVKECSQAASMQIINEVFEDLRKSTDQAALFISLTDYEIEQQSQYSDEQIDRLENIGNHANLLLDIDRLINDHLVERGKNASDVSVEERAFLREGVRRAQIEQQRLFQYRLRDRLLPYKPVDSLFAADVNCARATISSAHFSPVQSNGPTLVYAIGEYLERGKVNWTEKTYKDYARQLSFFSQFVGPDIYLSDIDANAIRQFRDKLQGLHKNHVNMPGVSIADKQATNDGNRISMATASKIFTRCKTFFSWATNDQGYYSDANPAEKISLSTNSKAKNPGRLPWSQEQLEKLFSSPLFLGFKSKNRRYKVGRHVIKDAHFWLPLLAYYTGARLGELVQLHHNDISWEHQIPHIHITENGSGGVGEETYKHIKSSAADRLIPIHPDLVELGFLDFLKARRRKKSVRVFPEIAFGKDGQASTVFSKWFGRYRKQIGITDPLIVFHSFRHNAEDAFRNATQPQYVIDAIIGHSDGKTSSAYGEGINLQRRYDAIRSMVLPVSVPVLWKNSEESDQK